MRQDLTDISVVLDRSGSMEVVRAETIGGFNKFLEEQKKQPGDALLTLMQFDTEFQLVHSGKKLSDVPALTHETFVPRGFTALLDAIGKTINETGRRLADMPEEQRPGKVIFVIVTDGEENSSHEFRQQQIHDMIESQRTKYSWEFVFLGANQDAIKTAATMGMPARSSMTYASNTMGTAAAFVSVANLTSNYRAGGQAMFTAEDREEQTKAGADNAAIDGSGQVTLTSEASTSLPIG